MTNNYHTFTLRHKHSEIAGTAVWSYNNEDLPADRHKHSEIAGTAVCIQRRRGDGVSGRHKHSEIAGTAVRAPVRKRAVPLAATSTLKSRGLRCGVLFFLLEDAVPPQAL